MWYFVLNAAIALWVLFDARSRKVDLSQSFFWAIGTFLLMIFVIPFYFAKRPLKEGEVREGGTSWNIIKYFAIFWTLLMFVAGLSGMMAASDSFNNFDHSGYSAGAAIGTAIGLGMIITLWFVVMIGALVIGLFLKKSSIVEKGPTGALALNIDVNPTPDVNKPLSKIYIVVIIIGGILVVTAIPQFMAYKRMYEKRSSGVEVMNEQKQIPLTTTQEIKSPNPLDKYVDQHVHIYEIFEKEPSIVNKLKSILYADYDAFYARLGVSSFSLEGDYYVGSGNMQHRGLSDNAAFAINKQSGEVYAIMLIDGKQVKWFGKNDVSTLPTPLFELYKSWGGEKKEPTAEVEEQNLSNIYDIKSYCRRIGSASGGSYQIENACREMEYEARSKISRIRVPVKIQNYCSRLGQAAGGSYQIMAACIDQETEAQGKLQ
jgi:hypothetical protein